ncbi:TPA_exp: putative AAA family ATPase [Trichophyton benhamiae CBS 112371]|nr:TPA_exp: putative AAA family ATPase [Trichophyton benhamiae CBS 112371]
MGLNVSEAIWRWRCRTFGTGDKIKPRSQTRNSASAPEENVQGADALIKILYEAKDSREDNRRWVDYPPKQLSKSVSKAQDRAAIKVYKIVDPDKPVISGRPTLKYFKITVQSPLLVAALKDIVEKDEIYLEKTEAAEFTTPFAPLYFNADEIAAMLKDAGKDTPFREHLELLLTLMDDMFAETRSRIQPLQASGLASFNLLWAYFPTGSPVYIWEGDCEFLGKVINTEIIKCNSRQILRLRCKIMKFDGQDYVWDEYKGVICAFEGNIPITDLPFYPLKFHDDPEAVKSRLIKRARKSLDYQRLSYGSYTAVALYKSKDGMIKHNVDGRILIDVVGYNKHHEAQRNTENGVENPIKRKTRILPTDKDPETEKFMLHITGPNNASLTGGVKPRTTKHISIEDQERNKKGILGLGDEMMYMCPFLEGFALKNKEWLNFYVEDIEQVKWNDEAYDHLVYDEQQKDLILSFVEHHYSSMKMSDDVITGKGQGLNILLSGPPGTGKTLTAEAVADRCRKPLFYLQAEDLGIQAAELGNNIKKVFELALEWNAVILLDEADVFMAERNPNDIHRNELVSIFLRELEYYRGVIFLTTNLYDTIDTAFRSRINLHLLFKSLSPSARLQVWTKFLSRLPPLPATAGRKEEKSALGDLNEEDLKELSMWQLNGREIKNAVKMVKSWCDQKGYDMTLSRMESGIKVSAPQATKRDFTKPMDLYD